MFLFANKALIFFGINLVFTKLSKINFISKLIMHELIFYNIINLKLLIYKIILFKNFIFLNKKYDKCPEEKLKLIFIDGSDNSEIKRYFSRYNLWYLQNFTWIPNYQKLFKTEELYFLLFWNIESFFLKLDYWDLNLPFFFFINQLRFRALKFYKLKDLQFLFISQNNTSSNFFWIFTIHNLCFKI